MLLQHSKVPVSQKELIYSIFIVSPNTLLKFHLRYPQSQLKQSLFYVSYVLIVLGAKSHSRKSAVPCII